MQKIKAYDNENQISKVYDIEFPIYVVGKYRILKFISVDKCESYLKKSILNNEYYYTELKTMHISSIHSLDSVLLKQFMYLKNNIEKFLVKEKNK